ncbi:MAG: hypothetical protein U0Z53_05080 [Blastocatellia bacterium]
MIEQSLKLTAIFLGGVIAFLAGMFCFWFFQHFGPSSEPIKDSNLKPVLVKFGMIQEKDRWIQEYQVYISPLDVLSRKGYMVLILIPYQNSKPLTVSAGKQEFKLTGFDDKGSWKPVFISPESLQENSGTPYIQLLDFGERQGLFSRDLSLNNLVVESVKKDTK